MYQLIIKRINQSTITTKFYNTMLEVVQHIKTLTGATFKELQQAQAKYQYQFYIKTI